MMDARNRTFPKPPPHTSYQLPIDMDYLLKVLLQLLDIHSPSGYTDRVVHCVGEELEKLGVRFELTRRGAIRATIKGEKPAPARAVVSHLDTIGAIVKSLGPNGRLTVAPVGHWSARWAEGARVTIFTDSQGAKRGTILPLKASGHTFGDEVDTQPVSWDNLEVRTDDFCRNQHELRALGFEIGNFVGVDSNPEITENGFINARHLDDKAGVASMLAAVKAVLDSGTRCRWTPTCCSPSPRRWVSGPPPCCTGTWPRWWPWTSPPPPPARTPASRGSPSPWPTRAAPSSTT
jgi:putative aminopeptidase FrvX